MCVWWGDGDEDDGPHSKWKLANEGWVLVTGVDFMLLQVSFTKSVKSIHLNNAYRTYENCSHSLTLICFAEQRQFTCQTFGVAVTHTQPSWWIPEHPSNSKNIHWHTQSQWEEFVLGIILPTTEYKLRLSYDPRTHPYTYEILHIEKILSNRVK